MQARRGGPFGVRAVSPNRMIQLFMSRHAPGRAVHVIRPAAAAASSDAAPAAAHAADLVAWVQQSGGSVSGVAVQRDAGGFGLAAAADCAAGSTLISLPQRCHLTYGDSTDPRLLALIEQVPAELWGAKLALAVAAHRLLGAASPFSPYINNLPLGVAGLPMFFDGTAMGMLQYPPVVEQVKKRCRWLLSFTQQALAPVRGTEADPFGGAEVDVNALGWALAVVTSRAFRTRGPGQPAAMLPLIDMCNHSFEPNAKIAPGPGGAMHMVATRPLKAGEAVHISYGPLENDFLLMDHGFLVPGNPHLAPVQASSTPLLFSPTHPQDYGFLVPRNTHDTVKLRFDRGLVEAAKAVAGVGSTGGPADGDDLPPLPAWQQRELAALGLAGPGANTEVAIRRQPQACGEGKDDAAAQRLQGPVDPRLLAGVRVLCAPSEAALGGRRGVDGLGVWDVPIAPAAELAALRTLTGLVAIALSQFTSSLEDDQKLLQGEAPAAAAGEGQQAAEAAAAPELTSEQRLAVSFRMDKKELLLAALAAISQRVQALAAQAAAAGGSSGAAGGGSSGGKGSGKKGQPPKSKTGGKGFGA